MLKKNIYSCYKSIYRFHVNIHSFYASLRTKRYITEALVSHLLNMLVWISSTRPVITDAAAALLCVDFSPVSRRTATNSPFWISLGPNSTLIGTP